MKLKSFILLVFLTACISLQISGQRTSDVENSKDHPLIGRFDKSVIEFYQETKWGTYKLPVSDKGKIDFDAPVRLEGKVTRIQYSAGSGNSSELVLQNYKTAFLKSGYKVLVAIAGAELGFTERPHTWGDKYYDAGGFYNGLDNKKFGMGVPLPTWKTDHSFIAAKGVNAGKEIYAVVYTVADEKFTLITQDVIEVELPETGLVTAENITRGIVADGRIAIYDIFFDTGKWEIKSESSAALKIISDYIRANPSKKFFIVGHTDNVGAFSDNVTLSENRAKAVMNDLVNKYGVAPSQLSAHGVASLSPLTNNATSEGKSRNRRVEIVEQ